MQICGANYYYTHYHVSMLHIQEFTISLYGKFDGDKGDLGTENPEG